MTWTKRVAEKGLNRRTLLAAGAVFILSAALLHQPVLRTLGGVVILEKADFSRADAVIVPGGLAPDRAFQAAKLLHHQRAGRAILFRESLPPNYEILNRLEIDFPEDHEISRRIFFRMGIEEARVEVIPGTVSSTWEEAQALRRYVDNYPLRSVVITTCRYHSYRAYLNFRKALEGTGIEIYSIPSEHCEFDPENWWKNRDQIKTLYVELAALVAFAFGRR